MMSCPLYKPYTNGRISLDVQSPCCPCVSLRSRSQLKVKYLTNKYYTLCHVRSITPWLMEGFPSNLNDIFTSTRGCAEPMLPMCQLKIKVTVKCQINQKQNLYTPKNFIDCSVSQVTSVCIISPFMHLSIFCPPGGGGRRAYTGL